jgi:hypothetical protein
MTFAGKRPALSRNRTARGQLNRRPHLASTTPTRPAQPERPTSRPRRRPVAVARTSATFGRWISRPRGPDRHHKRETRVDVSGPGVADHRSTGHRAERATRISFDDIAALLGLRADVAIRGRATAGRGAAHPGGGGASRPSGYRSSSAAGRSCSAADGARIGAVMPAMKPKSPRQLCRLWAAGLIVSSHAPGRRNEPAEHHTCDGPNHTNPFGSHHHHPLLTPTRPSFTRPDRALARSAARRRPKQGNAVRR